MSYGQNAFGRAVEELVKSPESIHDRLATAYCSHILVLYPPEIPRNPPEIEERHRLEWQSLNSEWRELQDIYQNLRNKITDGARITSPDDIRRHILELQENEASELAELVFLIYHRYLTNPPVTCKIRKAEAKERLTALWHHLTDVNGREPDMYSLWSDLHLDAAEILCLRTRLRGDWQEVHCWLLEIIEGKQESSN